MRQDNNANVVCVIMLKLTALIIITYLSIHLASFQKFQIQHYKLFADRFDSQSNRQQLTACHHDHHHHHQRTTFAMYYFILFALNA